MPDETTDLISRHCEPCRSGTGALDAARIAELLPQLPGWAVEGKELRKTCKFKNYYETIAFVNAIAWIAHHENHHPDLEVGYNRCSVRYSTHDVGGLSENDFICAAKVDALLSATSQTIG